MTSFALYEAYGARPYEWGNDPDRQKANTKEEESDLGLLNEGMRFRDLETGVFLTRDPIGYGDGPNVYCYVHCHPTTKFDEKGLNTNVISDGNDIYSTVDYVCYQSLEVSTFDVAMAPLEVTGAYLCAIPEGIGSVAEGYAGLANHADRASGQFGAAEQEWAQIESTIFNEAVSQLMSDPNARTLAFSAVESRMDNMSATEAAEGAGYLTGRILTGLAVSYLGSQVNVPQLGGPTVMAAGAGNVMELMNDLSNQLREGMSSGEFGNFSFENNLADQLTNEQIQEFLNSEGGQQLVAEVLESLVTGDAEFELNVEVDNQDDSYTLDFSYGDYEYNYSSDGSDED